MTSNAAVCSGVGGGSGGARGRNVGTSTLAAGATIVTGTAAASGRPASVVADAVAERAGDAGEPASAPTAVAGAGRVCAETVSANPSVKSVTAPPNHLEDRLAILILRPTPPVPCSAARARRRRP